MSAPIKIFASQNLTGQLAKEIGEDDVQLTEITNHIQDPHHFEITIAERKALAEADIIILNGLGYETWTTGINMAITKEKDKKKLDQLRKQRIPFETKKNGQILTRKKQKIIVIAELLNKKVNDDPHLWYSPNAFQSLAKQLFYEISHFMPHNRSKYNKNLKKILSRYKKFDELRNEIRAKYAGTAIAATEPVFSYMADDLKLLVLHQEFQRMIMNHSEPSVAQIVSFEKDLYTKKIKVLIENSQTHTTFTKHFVRIAMENQIPIVTVSETIPKNMKNHAEWMLIQLLSLKEALSSQERNKHTKSQ